MQYVIFVSICSNTGILQYDMILAKFIAVDLIIQVCQSSLSCYLMRTLKEMTRI